MVNTGTILTVIWVVTVIMWAMTVTWNVTIEDGPTTVIMTVV